eukprot:COSAG01_NODE_8352_length_2825_cov_19.830147_4_plen_92_part_00
MRARTARLSLVRALQEYDGGVATLDLSENRLGDDGAVAVLPLALGPTECALQVCFVRSLGGGARFPPTRGWDELRMSTHRHGVQRLTAGTE